jgi:hypothetical protein
MSQTKQNLLLIPLALLVVVIFSLHWARGSASAAAGELPPGLVKGAQFQILISSGGGIATETLEVMDTHGTWVHANVVQSQIWGKGDVWVNLASTDFGYVNVVGTPQPSK